MAPQRPLGSWLKLLDELIGSGWVSRHDDQLTLTEQGRTSFARLGRVVGRSREKLAQGISAADYDQTLGVLERMARNLGWTDPVISPGG